MDIKSRAFEAGLTVADQGIKDARAGKDPASAAYFAEMAVKTLPGLNDLEILAMCAEGLQENYMIGYEGGLNHGKAT